jgi:dTDP-4-dehydrorhamnose reductase
VKILLTGRNGQVGWELERSLNGLGEVVAFDRTRLDLADPDQIISAVRSVRPDVLVNAAAYTAVDRAESEPDTAHAINAFAPGLLSEEAKKLGALLVHYSTDYVFDGTKRGAYSEKDAPNPLNIYGRTKWAGERAVQAAGGRHLILRTSWVYAPRGKNFLLTILRLAKERKELRVVDDQIGAPTTSAMIAEATARILTCADPHGLYHLSASGRTSWHGFAEAILRGAGFGIPVMPIPTSQYPTPARRPANSLLDNTVLERHFEIRVPVWEEGLATSLRVLGYEGI